MPPFSVVRPLSLLNPGVIIKGLSGQRDIQVRDLQIATRQPVGPGREANLREMQLDQGSAIVLNQCLRTTVSFASAR